MKDKELCVALIKCITEVPLQHAESQSDALKIITIGVQSALKEQKEK